MQRIGPFDRPRVPIVVNQGSFFSREDHLEICLNTFRRYEVVGNKELKRLKEFYEKTPEGDWEILTRSVVVALDRRMSSRQAHIDYSNKLKENGNMIFGVAILNEDEKMIGSAVVYDFPSRRELNICLKKEPYILNNVWQKIDIKPCKVGPSFVSDFKILKK